MTRFRLLEVLDSRANKQGSAKGLGPGLVNSIPTVFVPELASSFHATWLQPFSWSLYRDLVFAFPMKQTYPMRIPIWAF